MLLITAIPSLSFICIIPCCQLTLASWLAADGGGDHRTQTHHHSAWYSLTHSTDLRGETQTSSRIVLYSLHCNAICSDSAEEKAAPLWESPVFGCFSTQRFRAHHDVRRPETDSSDVLKLPADMPLVALKVLSVVQEPLVFSATRVFCYTLSNPLRGPCCVHHIQ